MANYKVGYGQPPKATQLTRGKSGNPKGRPNGRRNLATDLATELGEPITVREEGHHRRMYCGPGLRHPAEPMLPAVDLGGRVWLGGRSCKGGPAAPAFGG